MRVYRGGGLTKDAVYLRGLIQLHEYLRTGGELESLLVGKISAENIPIIQELLWREVLHAPPAAAPLPRRPPSPQEARAGQGVSIDSRPCRAKEALMRFGFTFNYVQTKTPGPTTISLAMTAANRGHEVWAMGAADFSYGTDDKIYAHARCAPAEQYETAVDYHKALTGRRARVETITVDDLDLLMLRGDPSAEIARRPWAQTVVIDFGRLAMRHGVVVVNDPNGLVKARDKTYFQLFPKEVRPRTLISRNRHEIKRFVRDESGQAVLKPLQGSGGQSVFLVQPDDRPNLNQMIDAVSRDGYVVAQEYLPAAAEGDMRLFLVNGAPFLYQGKYAAFRRVRSGADMRSNISAGGKLRRAEVSEVHLKLAEAVRPKLVQDGMFLVGLDVVGDKLMEINVFSPGGLNSARMFEKVDFAGGVVDALERKVDYMRSYGRNFSNIDLATL